MLQRDDSAPIQQFPVEREQRRSQTPDAEMLYWLNERLGPQGPTGRSDKILIVADHDSAEADRVTLHLLRRGMPVCRLDPRELRDIGRLELYCAPHALDRLVLPLWDLPLEEIASVWLDVESQPGADEWSISLTSMLVLLEEARWLNRADRATVAQFSLPNVRAARAAGFDVPETLLTNNLQAAHAFADRRDGAILVRPPHAAGIEQIHPMEGQDVRALDNFMSGPRLFQYAVNVTQEVRVTVVNQRVFAGARVEGHATDIFAPHHLPQAVQSACLELTRRVGLELATLALDRRHDDRHVFLGLHPGGRWFPLEQAGLPIAEAVADALTGEASH